jgi:hypothetical protein
MVSHINYSRHRLFSAILYPVAGWDEEKLANGCQGGSMAERTSHSAS